MGYNNTQRKFHRKKGPRDAMLRTLAISLITHGAITTTEAKAKTLRSAVERMVSRARVDSVANRRIIAGRLGNNASATKFLFTEVAPKYKDRKGGYTRITKFPAISAKNDGRKTAKIEFI